MYHSCLLLIGKRYVIVQFTLVLHAPPLCDDGNDGRKETGWVNYTTLARPTPGALSPCRAHNPGYSNATAIVAAKCPSAVRKFVKSGYHRYRLNCDSPERLNEIRAEVRMGKRQRGSRLAKGRAGPEGREERQETNERKTSNPPRAAAWEANIHIQ